MANLPIFYYHTKIQTILQVVFKKRGVSIPTTPLKTEHSKILSYNSTPNDPNSSAHVLLFSMILDLLKFRRIYREGIGTLNLFV